MTRPPLGVVAGADSTPIQVPPKCSDWSFQFCLDLPPLQASLRFQPIKLEETGATDSVFVFKNVCMTLCRTFFLWCTKVFKSSCRVHGKSLLQRSGGMLGCGADAVPTELSSVHSTLSYDGLSNSHMRVDGQQTK